MAYLAFYRTFRPDTFESVVRQEHIIRILKNQITGDRISHAYLFCGPRGTGKTSIARIFARAINCESPVNGSPCGKCKTCKALSEGGNLDVYEIDAASNNGVDEMRDLREKVQYPPVNGRYKVYIVDEVHMLTDSAFNALLKTLEEPPKHAVFVMATTEPHKIPATILSRCMRFDFKLIPQEDLEKHLKSILNKIGKEYEEEAVSAIARSGAGSDRDMLSIADMCVSYSNGKLTYDDVTKVLGSADFYETGKLCSYILSGDGASALSQLEKIISEGKSVGVLVKDIMVFLNDCAIAKMCRGADRILSLPIKTYEYVKSVGDNADGHRLLRVTEIMAKTENDLKYSTSPRIILETAVIKAAMPETDYNIDALIARISELEKKVSEGIKVYSEPVREPVIEPKKPVREEKEPVYEEPYLMEEPSFVDYPEEPVFDEIPVEIPVKRSSLVEEKSSVREKKRASEPERQPERQPEKRIEERVDPPVKEVKKAAGTVDKTNAFGKFLRALRRGGGSGVLFVMCQDLTSDFKGDTFVLYTDSEVVFKSLKRENHAASVKAALESIGIYDYDIKLKGDESVSESLLDRVKEDFADINIEER